MKIALDAVSAAVELIRDSKHVVAMTGAGMSVESGIPTFRGPNGIWSRHGQPSANSYGEWLEDPDAFWSSERVRRVEPWVAELREALNQAKPNEGHFALAQMELSGILKSVVTQNIDGLHQDAGSVNVIEIHGSRYKMRCVDCGDRTPRETLFINSPPPPCVECGGRVKFDSVLFGEPIPQATLKAAQIESDRADCVIVIGTSTSVKPAGGLPRIAKANGATLIEINSSETPLTRSCDVVIRGTAASALLGLVESLSI
ncbi:MAG: NAD-dependent deacylase [Chloroflexi bacterium]|nr:NAD-dependent deacylase [Chloroflexota bacterium]